MLTIKILFLTIASGFIFSTPAKYISTVDGDTFKMYVQQDRRGNHYYGSVRLDGVDTPESSKRFAKCEKEIMLGKTATIFARKWMEKRSLNMNGSVPKWFNSKKYKFIIRSTHKDKFGRMLGTIESYNGDNLGNDLIRAGLAVEYHGKTKHNWCN